MKKVVQIKLILVILILPFIINSCKKGDTGPTGPEGQSGNSNIVSTTYSVSSWSWSSPYYYQNLSVPALTPTNVNSAAVMVYFNTSGTTWLALPYTQYNSPYDYFMGFSTSEGNVQVTWFYDSSLSSGSSPSTYYGSTIQFKVVVIPPAARIRNPNVDLRNYEEVKQAYGLKD